MHNKSRISKVDISISSVIDRPLLYKLIMRKNGNISHDKVACILKGFFLDDSNRVLEMYREFDANGSIQLHSYTRDIAETKLMELNKFINNNDCAIEIMMQKVNV